MAFAVEQMSEISTYKTIVNGSILVFLDGRALVVMIFYISLYCINKDATTQI